MPGRRARSRDDGLSDCGDRTTRSHRRSRERRVPVGSVCRRGHARGASVDSFCAGARSVSRHWRTALCARRRAGRDCGARQDPSGCTMRGHLERREAVAACRSAHTATRFSSLRRRARTDEFIAKNAASAAIPDPGLLLVSFTWRDFDLDAIDCRDSVAFLRVCEKAAPPGVRRKTTSCAPRHWVLAKPSRSSGQLDQQGCSASIQSGLGIPSNVSVAFRSSGCYFPG